MTSAAADRFNLADRGRIAPGFAADLFVFDPATVGDRASYEEPLERPIGIRHVLVAGVFALRDGEPTHATPGRILKPAGRSAHDSPDPRTHRRDRPALLGQARRGGHEPRARRTDLHR